MEPVSWVIAGSAVAALLAFLIALRGRRKRRERDMVRYEEAVSRGELPLTLHPVIDMDRCIGCLTCVKACPEGDILGEVDGKVMLVAPSHCIGHGRCAAECPSDAIKLVIGTAQRGVELPEISEYFESSRPGVHIIGELGGMGLIKNAMTQGMQVSRYLGKQVAKGGGRNEVSDVLIVGAGPAGLAAALGCREQGLSFRLVDQEKFGGTVANYPRHKLVMSETVHLPIVGKFGKRSMSKEDLLGAWQRIARRADIQVEEQTKVEGIDGEDGNFAVKSSRGVIRARKVVLATGRRGTPRKLGVPGEELPKVSYRLLEPEQYQGCRVMVVGGGDSAVEAACQIAEECQDVEVALSYRGDGFNRCREANRRKLQELVAAHRVLPLLGSEVKKITPTHVQLVSKGKPVALPNDYVIVCAGGEVPSQFLQSARIRLERLHGQELRRKAPRVPGKRGAKESPEEKRLRRTAFILFTVGALIVAGLTVVGWDYYRLPVPLRLRSPLHKMLRPAGLWGHGVGVVATLFMLSNFLYAARKRLRFLNGVSTIRRWLLFHQFVGFMSPLVIAFHAAFQSNNLLATATAGSLSIVVGTGLIGRFIYGLVPTRDGRAVEYADVVGRWERMKARVDPLFEMASDPESIREVLELATAPARKAGLLSLFFHLPVEALWVRWRLRRVRRFFKQRADYASFRGTFFQLLTLRRQVGFYVGLKKLLSTWRTFHAVLAVFLVVMIAGHIAVALYLGYGWIFM